MNWSIHPFPARMAPELALEKLTQLPSTAVILDPMAGSGTVLRQATDLGQRGIGFDMDPLAVLMSRVWTTPVDDQLAADVAERVAKRIDALAPAEANLPWIDNDPETAAFVDYWFAPLQREELRRIAYVIHQFSAEAATPDESAAVDLLKIALSRTIITKDKGASLARDVSHSRPHKIGETSDFAVRSAFDRSIKAVRRRL